MNLIDFENRMLEHEIFLKNDINNLEEFLSDFSIKKYDNFNILAALLTILIAFFLLFFCSIYVLSTLVTRDNLVGIFIVGELMFFLFFPFCSSFGSILSKFTDKLVSFLNYIFNSHISYETYQSEKNRLEFLLHKLRATQNIIYKYNIAIDIKRNLYSEEVNFVAAKMKWESNIDVREKEFHSIIIDSSINFTTYEYLKYLYFKEIELKIKSYYERIELSLNDLYKLFIEIDSYKKMMLYYSNLILNYKFGQFEILGFEEFLKHQTNNSKTNVSGKRLRASGMRNHGSNKGRIPSLIHKEDLDWDLKNFDTTQHVKNINLGLSGELFVLEYEKKRLINQGRFKLAKKVQHVSKLYGDKHGYDVLSYDNNGKSKWIEVKTTTGEVSDDFYLSENEYNTMINSKRYFIYRVYDFCIEENIGQIREIQCSNEMDRLNFNVTKFKVQPNKLLNVTTRGLE